MNYIICEREDESESAHSAFAESKARTDVYSILIGMDYHPIFINVDDRMRKSKNIVNKIKYYILSSKSWRRKTSTIVQRDTVVIQLPAKGAFFWRTLKSMKRRGVKLIGIIHDIESIRAVHYDSVSLLSKLKIKIEEPALFPVFDSLIVHNTAMMGYVSQRYNVPEERIVTLDIFDYLVPNFKAACPASKNGVIIIAGNFSEEKAKYVYSLPLNLDFELYGINYSNGTHGNIHYHGAYDANELPNIMEGSFGLVWDGDSTNTCSGITGEYLKFNNPHKTSLYLASGIPVIIWSKAAMAPFIEKNGCGILIDSLHEIYSEIESMSNKDYEKMKENAARIGEQLRSGYYLTKAINH